MNHSELLEKRAALVEQARGILSKAEGEKRELTAEERGQYDKMMDDSDTMKADADRAKRSEDAAKELAESRGRKTESAVNGKTEDRTETKFIELRKSIVGDVRRVALSGPTDTDEYRTAFIRALAGDKGAIDKLASESRALQKDADIYGGYLSAPQVWLGELIQAVDNDVFMRQIARVLPPLLTSGTVGAPSLDNDPADPTWTTEILVGSEDSTLSFGKRELTPHPLAQYLKVSRKLLRNSSISADAIVRNRLAYKMGVVMEAAYMTGSGAAQPLGVFTASDDGISTDRDVSTGNTDTEMRFDGLMEALYTLKPQYQNRATWIFNKAGVKQLRKLKDGEGRYIWQPSVVAGTPDTILTRPVMQSEYAPSTFETGLYVGIVGDFSQYWIVDALNATIQVLLELYAATNQNGYYIRAESDAMPVLEEAFVRVTLA
ncbi:MAG TPA: phage major capsid protein [Phycisphaerae bacterium]|nr:phage major capsid protein [Phycisphaerae bacterium]